jgi:hypothetical protein
VGACDVRISGTLGSLDCRLHAELLRRIRSALSCLGDAATQKQKTLLVLVPVNLVHPLAHDRRRARELSHRLEDAPPDHLGFRETCYDRLVG